MMNSKGPRTDPWDTPCFIAPQSEKKPCKLLDDPISAFYLLYVRQDLNQFAPVP
jgi:hypothetical protein